MHSAYTKSSPTAADDYDPILPQVHASRNYTINTPKRNPRWLMMKDVQPRLYLSF